MQTTKSVSEGIQLEEISPLANSEYLTDPANGPNPVDILALDDAPNPYVAQTPAAVPNPFVLPNSAAVPNFYGAPVVASLTDTNSDFSPTWPSFFEMRR